MMTLMSGDLEVVDITDVHITPKPRYLILNDLQKYSIYYKY